MKLVGSNNLGRALPVATALLIAGLAACGGDADPSPTPESTWTWVYRTPTPTPEPATPTPIPAGITALVAEWVKTERGGQFVGPCEAPAPLRPNAGAPYCITTVSGDAGAGLRVGVGGLGSDADSWWLTFTRDDSGGWHSDGAEPVSGAV